MEVIQYTSPDEVAVCNLGLLALLHFVLADGKSYNFKKLHETTKFLT
jgi:hypothetical protein